MKIITPMVMKVSARLKTGKVWPINGMEKGKVMEIKSITQPKCRRSIILLTAPAVISRSE